MKLQSLFAIWHVLNFTSLYPFHRAHSWSDEIRGTNSFSTLYLQALKDLLLPKNEYVDTAAFSFIQNSYFTVVLAIASFHKRAIYVFMAEFVMCKRSINKKCKGTLNSRPLESVKNNI